MILRDTNSATGSQEGGSGHSQPEWQDGQTTNPSGQARARASRTASRARKKEPMIQGTFGRTYVESSVKLDQISLWESRFLARVAMVGSTESAMILRQKVTPAGRRILRLVPSTRLTNAPGSTGGQSAKWATPKVSTGAYQLDGRTGQVCANLIGQMDPSKLPEGARWPTPRTQCNAPSSVETARQREDNHARLEERMVQNPALWCTAAARDWKDSAGMAISEGDRQRLDQLPRQMAHLTGETTGSSATTTNRGAPNPAFAFWLMGFSYPWMLSTAKALINFKSPTAKKPGA